MTQNLPYIGTRGIVKVLNVLHRVLAPHLDLSEQGRLVDQFRQKIVYPTTIITIVIVLVLVVLRAPL